MPDNTIKTLLRGLGPADISLAAFAQLAVLTLAANHCLISLVDTDHEYVVSRASNLSPPTKAWQPPLSSTSKGIPESVTPIPRAQGPSATAFHRWQALLLAQPSRPLPVLSGPDKPNDSPESFLAAAPILYSAGNLVGCLLVFSDRQDPDGGLSQRSSLADIARTIGRHLDLIRSEALLNRSRIIARGLDVFHAGGENLSEELGTSGSFNAARSRASRLLLGDRCFNALHIDEVDRPDGKPSEQSDPLTGDSPSRNVLVSRETPSSLVNKSGSEDEAIAVVITDNESTSTSAVEEAFSRACKLMLQVSNLDGVLFLDAGTARVRSMSQGRGNDGDEDVRVARTLGYSTRHPNDIRDRQQITEQQLHSLMEAFPLGQIFVSDTSNSSSTFTGGQTVHIPDLCPPSATSFIFVPFREARGKRWRAGCFAWVESSAVEFEPAVDIPFVSSYGHSVLLEAARVQADAAESVKSRFIGSITHELRSPLHGIMGGVEYIRAAPLPAFEKHMLDTVESCGNTLLDMIENVLDLSGLNIQAKGKDHEHPNSRGNESDTSASEVVDMVVMIEEVMMSALLAHITLSRALSPEDERSPEARSTMVRSSSSRLLKPRLPQVIIKTDWTRDWICSLPAGSLRRVILSLFTNALKFTKSGHILVEAQPAEQPESGESAAADNCDVSLSIVDTGKGLSEEFLRLHAGKAFQQEDVLTTGTGLGLHLVHKTVREVKGRVEMQSIQGQGTQVKVYLPTSRYVPPASIPDQPTARSIRTYVNGMLVALLGWDVLEDSRDNQGLQLAKQTFVELFGACFGMKVMTDLDAAAEGNPDVTLCDDMRFESLRADGTLEKYRLKPKAFLVFCSSIRYAAHMSDEYPDISFLTPPPGPNQLSRVLARYFDEDADKRRDQITDGPKSRTEATEAVLAKVGADEERFQRVSDRTAETIQPIEGDQPLELEQDTAEKDSKRKNATEPDATEQDTVKENKTDQLSAGQEVIEGGTMKQDLPKPPPDQGTTAVRRRVLLVEDNQINMQLLVRFAKKQQIDFGTACDGAEALEAYQKAAEDSKPFGAVIMDISMPVMDGLESTRQIRHWEIEQGLQASRIIALTGAVTPSAREDALNAGCDIFMAKPASFQKITDVLRDVS